MKTHLQETCNAVENKGNIYLKRRAEKQMSDQAEAKIEQLWNMPNTKAYSTECRARLIEGRPGMVQSIAWKAFQGTGWSTGSLAMATMSCIFQSQTPSYRQIFHCWRQVADLKA